MKTKFQEVLDILNDPTNYWIDDSYNIILHKKTDKPITFFDLKKSSLKFKLWYVTAPFSMRICENGAVTLFPHYSGTPFKLVERLFNTKRWQIYSAVNRILISDRCYFYNYGGK